MDANNTRRKSYMVDFYIPDQIVDHRVVRGGGSPPQLQFLVEWKDGWTEDKKLAKHILKRHHLENTLFFVKFKKSWEPYVNQTIKYLIATYKAKRSISTFSVKV